MVRNRCTHLAMASNRLSLLADRFPFFGPRCQTLVSARNPEKPLSVLRLRGVARHGARLDRPLMPALRAQKEVVVRHPSHPVQLVCTKPNKEVAGSSRLRSRDVGMRMRPMSGACWRQSGDLRQRWEREAQVWRSRQNREERMLRENQVAVLRDIAQSIAFADDMQGEIDTLIR